MGGLGAETARLPEENSAKTNKSVSVRMDKLVWFKGQRKH